MQPLYHVEDPQLGDLQHPQLGLDRRRTPGEGLGLLASGPRAARAI